MTLFVRLLLYWLTFFAAFRLWFMLWFSKEWSAGHPASVWHSFYYALPLDLSMAGYFLALPVLLWFTGVALGPKTYPFFSRVIYWINGGIIALAVLAFGANIFIYEEWQTLLNQRAIYYALDTPDVLANSMSLPFLIGAVLLCAGAIGLFVYTYRKLVTTDAFPRPVSRWYLLGFPVVLGLLVVAIRGIGVMPINESAVYYSTHAFNNHAATNTGWHLAHSLLEKRTITNKYTSENPISAEQKQWLLNTYTQEPTRPLLDSTGAPVNVVVVLMESMTAQVIEELGGEPGVCPHISRLIREGLLMSNCYGSGYRTDQGLVSVLAGYPAQPDQSVIFHVEKGEKLRALPRYLKEKHGYSTLFVHGSELTFANFRVWLSNQKTDLILGKEAFSPEERNIRWGADDQRIMERTLKEINALQPPFFATALTVSLHAPFDSPVQVRWTDGSPKAAFLNHAAHADAAIGAFMERAAQQPWYPNTLFILVADHGASLPSGRGMDEPITRHVPLVFFSPRLRPELRGTRNEVFGGHHDIPATVLRALDPQAPVAELFPWSRDLMAMETWFQAHPAEKERNFAYYTNENGLGWVTPTGQGFYHFVDKSWYFKGPPFSDGVKADARAWLHLLYDDFLGL